MESHALKRKHLRVISFLVCISILMGTAALVSAVRVSGLKKSAELSSQMALSELCENLDNITTQLQKSMYCSGDSMLSDISSKLSTSSSCAKLSLSRLTDENTETDDIYKFLSQVGDFTSALAKKVKKGEMLTAKERTVIGKLYKYSLSLSDGLDEIRTDCYDSSVHFEKKLSNADLPSEKDMALFSDKMHDTQKSLEDYPTLIYDGPFSDSLLERDAAFLKDKKAVSVKEAEKLAAEYIGTGTSSLRRESDENSQIELYCFGEGEKTVAVTKKGGLLCYITNPDFSYEEKISAKEAVRIAEEYLEKIGYKKMKDSYYAVYDGVCTVNFAFYDSSVIYYSDLIKVSVALDTGKIVALDARGFITNHCSRELAQIKVSSKEAKKRLAENLTVLSERTALIPSDNGSEKLCHEFRCRDKSGAQLLIYVDVVTGEEVDILLLIFADGGTLTK